MEMGNTTETISGTFLIPVEKKTSRDYSNGIVGTLQKVSLNDRVSDVNRKCFSVSYSFLRSQLQIRLSPAPIQVLLILKSQSFY